MYIICTYERSTQCTGSAVAGSWCSEPDELRAADRREGAGSGLQWDAGGGGDGGAREGVMSEGKLEGRGMLYKGNIQGKEAGQGWLRVHPPLLSLTTLVATSIAA
ncbi:hypothetical protein M758_8G015600 [Ceratodon purpureus]|nr:hypothetical protein M758_8G015600 [Ceratodon purpureus]